MYLHGHYAVSGLPSVGDTLALGPRSTPVIFHFAANDLISTNIPINDAPSVSELCSRMAAVINGADGVGCSASVDGTNVVITPTDGNITVQANATNVAAVLFDPDPEGVLFPN